MIQEDIFAVGWRAPDSKKGPSPTLVIYVGSDWEAGRDAANSALDAGVVAFARVIRGQFPAGGQVMWSGTIDNRPGPSFSEVLPATGRK